MDASLAEVIAENGYFDQAHRVHDFGDLTGVAASVYQPAARSELHMEVPAGIDAID